MRDQHIFQPGEVTRADHIGLAEFIANPAPDPSDINGTLAYWDEYRRKKRAQYDALGLREQVVQITDGPAAGMSILPAAVFREHIKMDDPVTDENIERAKRLSLHMDTAFPTAPTPTRERLPLWTRVKVWFYSALERLRR